MKLSLVRGRHKHFITVTVMAMAFALNDASVPEVLRGRIESWHYMQPKTQFHQYGPLNAYLSLKFPPHKFLVKPQALLRELWDTAGMEQADLDSLRAFILGLDDLTMDVDEPMKVELKKRTSIDSQGGLVDTDKCHYPDFVVTAYGESGDYGEDGDVIRLVIEVGSLGRDLKPPSIDDKMNILTQLRHYLRVMGKMGVCWETKAVGMCILGMEVAILQSKGNGDFPLTTTWYSLYEDKFTNVVNMLANL